MIHLKYFIVSFILLGSVYFNLFTAQIVINEISAANISNHIDDFGDTPDWIELYNMSAAPVDLSGWFITDRVNKPYKFQIPSGSIPANGYMMVYCTGRAISTTNAIHTNFKITQTKYETIMLSDAGGLFIDSIGVTPTQTNHSRGRTTDGAAAWSLFTAPTPDASNSNDQNEYAQKPVFSVDGGVYGSGQTLSLAVASPTTTIHYTLDGTTPDNTSPVYSAPININANTVVRAIGISSDPNTPNSFVETNTYLIAVSHTMKIMTICGDDIMNFITDVHPNAFTDNFDGHIELFDANGVLLDEGVGFYNKHGNDSWAYDQRGFDFVMRDAYGYNHAINNEIFRGKSRDEFQRLILKAAANDNYPAEDGAHIRDSYVHSLSQVGKLKLDERSFEPCVLYVNGQYWGLYDIREKVDDSDFTDYYNDQDEKYKDSPEYLQFLKTWGATWVEYGTAQATTDWDNFKNYVITNNMADPIPFNYVDSVYNWKSLVDYFVLNSYIVSADWLNWNTAWWRGLDTLGDKKKWRYVLWDMDASFGHYANYTGIPVTDATADPCNAENLPDPGGQGHTVILNELLNNPIVEQYYISRYIDLSNTTLSCDFMIAHLDSLLNLIEPEMNGQIARWGGTYAGWQDNVQDLKNFINQRCAEMTNGLIGCYNLTGPYNLTFEVDPPLYGEIKCNSVTFDTYPFTGTYFGNIDILLEAKPFAGYQFQYWQMVDVPTPADDSVEVSFQATQDQTIIAHFATEGEEPAVTYEGVFVPTAFSPNNDGQNDLLELFIGRDVRQFKFELFNRWGQQVFATSDAGISWDGTLDGAELNTGVFVYQLEAQFNDGRTEKRFGNITLMR